MSAIHRIFALMLALASAAVWAQPASGTRRAVDVDRVVAVVNNDIVTANELDQRGRLIMKQLRAQNIDIPPPEILARQVLERLIMDRALVQSARELGLRIDDAQLDRAIGRISEENRLTPAQLREQVERDGMSWARFRNDVRDEILVSRLREREVDARIQISEADVDAYLAEQSGHQAAPELNIAQILVRVPEGADAAVIERQRQRADEVRKQAAQGTDFARLAAEFSDSQEAMQGGVLGLRSADRLPPLFVDAVVSLAPGQVAAVVRSPAGFHVLKLVERKVSGPAGSDAPVMQTHARHILIRITDLVPEGEARRRLTEVRDRIVNGKADFAELARQYSADGTASRGGDLGWLYPGDTVPDFERAMNALAVNAVSDIVKTEFGLHLVQVLARRTDAASPERVRAAARAALRDRRVGETTQDWMRQVRDRAYVEYRDR